ncbi:hypothetical protein B0H19DRAFT_1077740 [Mycena capillaripes]|nr:hypothetical protein B0H19DRAFT_1077740 [Mycena capillaripes]
MHHTGQLRPLLPKSVSQMRPELFQIQERRTQLDDEAMIDRTAQEFNRRSLGQRKRQQKEKENRGQYGPVDGPKLLNPSRSAAQQGRRQRELAEQIEGLLQTRGQGNFRCQAQTLRRRRAEQAEKRLEFDAVCAGKILFLVDSSRFFLSVRPRDIDAKMTSGVLGITSFIPVISVAKHGSAASGVLMRVELRTSDQGAREDSSRSSNP